MSKDFDPSKARTLDELYQMEAEYYQRNIPYSQQLSENQMEIADEMSNYGSNLTPMLSACGVLSCLGITAYAWLKRRRPNQHHNFNPNEQNEDLFEVPYYPEDFENQNE